MCNSSKTCSAVVLVLLTAAALNVVSCGSQNGRAADAVERHKRLAGELRDNKLYRAAIDEYQKILDNEALDDPTLANINYLIARIYFEDLQDYENAAAHYVRAKALDPQGSFVDEASRKLVASLEKMGRMIDARRQLAAVTDLDAEPQKEGDVAVARIGGVPVWRSEIEERIQSLPPELQQKFMTRETRLQFVRSYVGTELLYHAAVREDYGNDPAIKKQQNLLYKKLLVDKYVVDKVMPQIRIDSADVRNYYVAHQTDRYHDAPYDSVQATVFLDYQTEKMEAAFSDYIAQLAKVERVEFLDQNVK
ncbi:MAG TPA: hypothetical protein VN285_01240 [Candidatus Deferrimicrobium sp.]|nr:hypothetical protein [Candidatus Deferrimicrobium sp.]